MFVVSYHILSTRISWNDIFYFESKQQVEEYLEKRNFKKNNIFYEKEGSGWFPKTSAMITKLKEYEGDFK